ncbi:MAG: nicotinate (nicotinamide) nucleotide adenylyltransferase [Clostridia bacterium]|nr:nicotinate (nicotinamide) nucleotide adenylyltransferase [Clostridia bacterium]
MKNTVIFGGTFNPIHSGHIEIIRNVLALPNTEKVIVMPTAVPPHKVSDNLACDADRFEMCKLACSNMINVEVSDLELLRGGKSYTYETLKKIKNENPTVKLAFVCGGDMIVTFKEWYRYEDILKLAEIIAVRRAGIDEADFKKAVAELVTMGGVVNVLKGEITDISSTEIKKNIGNMSYLLSFLPEKVYEYIVNNNLYLGDKNGL